MKNSHSARVRRQKDRRETASARTLSDFEVPIPLECFHCEKTFTGANPVELVGKTAIVHCLSCGNMTPFEFQPVMYPIVGEA